MSGQLFEKKIAPNDLLLKCKDNLPVDVFFPSLLDKVERRTCEVCQKYHASIKSLTAHRKAAHPRKRGRGARKTKDKQDFIEDDLEEADLTPLETADPPRRSGRRAKDTGDKEHLVEEDMDQSDAELDETVIEKMIEDEIVDEFDDYIDVMGEEPGVTISVGMTRTIVKILDLKEWLKSPWSSDVL